MVKCERLNGKSQYNIIVIVLIGFTSVSAECVDPYAVPRDSYSMPAVFKPKDFCCLSRLFIQPGNTIWMADNYKYADLERVAIDRQEWVRWHFMKKTDTFIPSLAYRYPSRIAPERFSVRVLNRSKTSVSFSMWGETKIENWQTVEPNEIRIIAFDEGPTLVVQGTNVDVEYDIQLRDLTIYYPEANGLAVTKLDVPDKLVAGSKIKIDLGMEGSRPNTKALQLELRHDPWVIWRIDLSDNETSELSEKRECVIEREVPWYLPTGEGTIGLTADGYRIKGSQARVTVVNDHRPGLPRVERKMYNGRPTFFIDNKPFIWSGYATYFNFSPVTFKEFGANNANVFHITCAPGRHYHNVAAPTWLGGDDYDFGEVEQWATTILSANPDAKIIFRLALGLPPFWFNENPDSQVRIQTIDGRELKYLETDSKVATLTSEAWRKQQAVALTKLIEFISSQPWASQAVGFNLGGAMTEEWFAWASNDEIIKPVKIFSDYSPVNQKTFREWCAAKGYPYDRIPEPSLRKRPDHDLFVDDENGRWAAAYNAFINEKTAETLKYFAAVVKRETGGRSLAGAYFGYVILLTGEARQSDSGQFGLTDVLRCDDIDYISGVPQHMLRHLCGDGYAGQPTAIESILAHGKQYVDDDDLFSWLHHGIWHIEYDVKDPPRAAIEMHRRWFAAEAVRGNSYQWFSLSPKWHRDDRMMSEFAIEAKILGDTLNLNRTPTEEIAFVVDDHTFNWFTPEAKAQYGNQALMGALGRTGAPMGVWLLSDIEWLPERIKFVVVVNVSAPKNIDTDKLKKLIYRGGRTIMVVGPAGLVDSQTHRYDITRVEKLIGLPIRLDTEPKPARAASVETGQWLCPMQINSRDMLIAPRAYVDCDGFMKYEDSKTAGAERALANGGRLIWCGVPPYASEQWLCKQVHAAGVHCYAPVPCSVHSSKELVAITSVYFDDRDIELNWPEDVIITDLFSGWQGKGRKISCPFDHGQTRLFKVETK